MHNPHPAQYARIPFTRSNGYLVRMFGHRDAAFFIESLLKMNAPDVHLIGNVPGWHGALMVSQPSVPGTHPDALANDEHPLWLLDFVPQPQVIVAHLRMPVFFVQNNGVIGLPLSRAAVGDTSSLRNADRPAPLGGGHSTQIRIAWPGYESWERQIQIRDQTRHRNEITLERFAKLVAGVVDRFLAHGAMVVTRDSAWRVGNGAITRNNVIIVGTVQVSAGGWMPILQILPLNPNGTPAHFYSS
ncbi:hypothetical protein EDB92DRAFT_1984777 [Lactarius akahatsu]|uniref:Uncharacterized protein n=1 Tax=Lactarius akahatsu TaxID=416441 RepID=A0AAD4LUL2_9AGAM|nr:hypothetical protein EDB92DRAFT_1984777 [Lactarius akahatsu]